MTEINEEKIIGRKKGGRKKYSRMTHNCLSSWFFPIAISLSPSLTLSIYQLLFPPGTVQLPSSWPSPLLQLHKCHPYPSLWCLLWPFTHIRGYTLKLLPSAMTTQPSILILSLSNSTQCKVLLPHIFTPVFLKTPGSFLFYHSCKLNRTVG